MYNLRDRENRSGFGPCSRPLFPADRPYSGMGYISPLPRLPCFSRPGFSGSYSRSRRSSIGGTACSRSRYSTWAFLCIAAGRTGSRPLLQLAVAMRLWVMAVLAVLVAVRLAPVVVLVVGLIDLASAALTSWALRAESRQRLQPERQDRRGRRATRV